MRHRPGAERGLPAFPQAEVTGIDLPGYDGCFSRPTVTNISRPLADYFECPFEAGA